MSETMAASHRGLTPPSLRFIGDRPSEEERIRLIESLATKMHIKRRESAVTLFLFYCDLDDGFAPSEAYITKSLAMCKKSYLRGRSSLCDAGLINWDRDENKIEINFHILGVLDMLSPSLANFTSAGSKVSYPKLKDEEESHRTIGERNRYYPGYFSTSHLNEYEKHFFKAIDRMTPKEECEVFGIKYDKELEENWRDNSWRLIDEPEPLKEIKSTSSDWVDNLRPVRKNPNCDMKLFINECRKSEEYVVDPGYSWDTHVYKVCFNGKWTCFDADGMRIK